MSNTRAFTLIELLLATALMVVLIGAVLSVITGVWADGVGREPTSSAAGRIARDGASFDRAALDRWVDLLRYDIELAQDIDTRTPNQVMLVTSTRVDWSNRELTHRPVRVYYTIEPIDGTPWIIRTQVGLDDTANHNVQRDLVCSGVTRLALVGSAAQGARDTSSVPRAISPTTRTARSDADAGAKAKAPPSVRQAGTRDPNETVVVTGMNYYRKNAPAWALRKIDANRGATMTGSTAPTDGASTDAPTRAQAARSVTCWRLKVWSAAGDEPAHDRMVAFEVNEAE